VRIFPLYCINILRGENITDSQLKRNPTTFPAICPPRQFLRRVGFPVLIFISVHHQEKEEVVEAVE
jgi:hypothetical protein